MRITIKKQNYISPQIIRIKLDNEISLILISADGDPGEPGLNASNANDYFNNKPYKSTSLT
jgi:hypothetical protein